MVIKKRLDQKMQEESTAYSRQQIQSWIMQGKVKVNGAVVTKPGAQVANDAILTYDIHESRYVSRAGFKLEKALQHFAINVTGMTALDAGLSTGGFADCLLQHGVKKIYGVDVGYGQVHEKIRTDLRVILLERTNLRELKDVGEPIDLITLDLSFISVLKVMEAVDSLLKNDGALIVLIKPQFEAGKHEVGRGGIIKDSHVHEQVIKKIQEGIAAHGYTCEGIIESPIEGATGNKEFLGYFKRGVNE